MFKYVVPDEEGGKRQSECLSWINEGLKEDRRNDTLVNMFSDKFFATAFFHCPASTRFHNCHPGGLWDHTKNVIQQIFKLAQVYPEIAPSSASLFLISLCHDMGKIGDGNNSFYVQDGSRYVYNRNIRLPHEDLSLYWLQKFNVLLGVDEWQAIKYHNGPYVPGYDSVCWKEYPTLFFLHTADVWAVHCEKLNIKLA